MIDRLSKAAERLATGVSRRRFLDKAGKGALALAAGLGGLLAASSGAEAAKGGKGKPPKPPEEGRYHCCHYGYSSWPYGFYGFTTCQGEPCLSELDGYPLYSQTRVKNCKKECHGGTVL